MMDHYEELGLDRSASTTQIRQAYKRLVRLLHPDLCAHESLRRLADLQTKRLNAILTVLSDPALRAEYDRSLAMAPPATAIRRPASGQPPKWFYLVAAVIVLVSLASVWQRGSPPPLAEGTLPPHTPAPKDLGAPRTLTPPRHVHSSRSRPTPPAAPPPDEPPPPGDRPPDASPRTDKPIAGIADIVGRVEEPPIARFPPNAWATESTRPTLAGEWLFVPAARSRSPNLYPPEYIELRMTEDAGVLRGRYRARYTVSDRAISPNVAFQFEGRSEGGGARLPWMGAGGARGEVSLRLLDTGSLEVTWIASKLGADLKLVSGTATLVRKLN